MRNQCRTSVIADIVDYLGIVNEMTLGAQPVFMYAPRHTAFQLQKRGYVENMNSVANPIIAKETHGIRNCATALRQKPNKDRTLRRRTLVRQCRGS